MSRLRHLPFLLGLAAIAAALAAPAQASQELAVKGTCVACHMPDKKLVGPSWHDVAKKYKNQPGAVDMLAARIRKGGKDVWSPVPMAPLGKDKISDADLKTVLVWVLKTP